MTAKILPMPARARGRRKLRATPAEVVDLVTEDAAADVYAAIVRRLRRARPDLLPPLARAVSAALVALGEPPIKIPGGAA